jgi:hypothetical protein
MPIAIKEFLLSDSISELSEKLNFNFDQIVLAGGGPPGPIGPQGVAGVAGPQGKRGDHWFVGATTIGLTADHDGSSDLKVQDLFLDSDGNVLKYFEISGSTGWTSTGINLKGPQGVEGVTGGSFEWKIYLASTAGNVVSTNGFYGPDFNPGTDNNDINFAIPTSTYKNSIFLGDPNWSYSYLEEFGTNPYQSNAAGSSAYVPKLTIVQKEVNSVGVNGLSFGAYGLTSGIGLQEVYGDTTSLTDSYSFVNAGFMTEPLGAGSHKTKWRLFSPRVPLEIRAGDEISSGSNVLPSSMRLISDEIVIRNYNLKNSIKIKPPLSVNDPDRIVGTVRELSINSWAELLSFSDSANNNIYSYIALQNEPGGIAQMVQHSHGNVVIGPTVGPVLNGDRPYSGSPGSVLGVGSPQALAIVRDITQPDTIDAAVRFIYPSEFRSFAGISGRRIDKIKSTWIGSIVPVRTKTTSAWPDLDYMVISSGLGSGFISGVTAGGRIGITNTVLHGDGNKGYVPQHAFHVSIIKDKWTTSAGWLGDTSMKTGPTGELDFFFAGFDVANIQSLSEASDSTKRRGVGIGFAAKEFVDVVGSTSLLAVIQTYYKGDSPHGSADTDNSAFTAPFAQGYGTPNLYLQPYNTPNNWGDESGNVAIGFVPNSVYDPGYPSAPGSTFAYYRGHYPFSKLSINGSITIAGKTSGFHTQFVTRPKNGILVEGPIIGGRGSTYSAKQYGNSWFGGAEFLNANPALPYGLGVQNINASFDKLVMAGNYTTKYSGYPSPFPEYSFSDMRTGIRMKYTGTYNSMEYNSPDFGFSTNRNTLLTPYSGRGGVGQLVAGPHHQLNDFTQIPYMIGGPGFTASKVVAEWASSGDLMRGYRTRQGGAGDSTLNAGPDPVLGWVFPAIGYENNTEYSSLKITDTISKEILYKDVSDLEKRYVFFNVDTAGGWDHVPAGSSIGERGGLRFRGIYYKIPTNKSICYLRSPGTYYGQYYDLVNTNGRLIRISNAQSLFYLNGFTWEGKEIPAQIAHRERAKRFDLTSSEPTSATTTIIPMKWDWNNMNPDGNGARSREAMKRFNYYWPSNFAYFDDGHYYGQEFTLITGDMSSNNSLYLDGTPPSEGFMKKWEYFTINNNYTISAAAPEGNRTLQVEEVSEGNLDPSTPEPYKSYSQGGAVGWNNNDRILKVKSKIVLPLAADSERLAPGTPWGPYDFNEKRSIISPANNIPTGINELGSSIERSSIAGNKLGTTIKSNTVYKFVWLPGDWQMEDFISYRNSVPTNPGGLDGRYRYFTKDSNAGTNNRTVPDYLITGIDGPKNDAIGDPALYDHSGAWVCIGMERLVRRNFFDYGAVNPIVKFADWDF